MMEVCGRDAEVPLCTGEVCLDGPTLGYPAPVRGSIKAAPPAVCGIVGLVQKVQFAG